LKNIQNFIVDTLREDFIKEFKLSWRDKQSLIELQDIKQSEVENSWECIQRFKYDLGKLNLTIHLYYQKEWFIQALLPLTRIPLTQKNIDAWQEASEK